MVEINAFSALKRGELTTVTGWIDRLPEKIVHEHPMLSVYRAWALLLTGQVSQIEPSLQAVGSALHPGSDRLSDEKQIPAATVGADEIEGHLSAIRCYVAALSGEPTRAMALGQRVAGSSAQGKRRRAQHCHLCFGRSGRDARRHGIGRGGICRRRRARPNVRKHQPGGPGHACIGRHPGDAGSASSGFGNLPRCV